ncbi:DUF6578 domain-containing protein [Rathayibacter caricis]|uniref:DUF6578 domain-containing protein n=1 Tax=Rathayibacter caricis TaxID=110936 RepID=UPI001FB4CD31|nr:DUF6578 domain-containing protein [Rathayibacter caricis]
MGRQLDDDGGTMISEHTVHERDGADAEPARNGTATNEAARNGTATNEAATGGAAADEAANGDLVDVELEGWAMTCCGEPFAVGDRVTWTLIALEPRSPGVRPRFLEEHHEPTRPARPVAGVVRGLVGRTVLGARLAIGEGVLVPDRSRRRVQRLDGWDGTRGGIDLTAVLEIDDRTDLPEYEAPREAVRESLPPPPAEVIAALHERLVRLHHDHGARLRIRSLHGGRKASLLPEAEGARPVHWSVGPTSVSVNLGDRRFLLPADADGVAEVDRILDAIVRGDVAQGGLTPPLARSNVPSSPW